MTDSLVPRVGGILSADIAVPEHDRTVQFYSRILTTGRTPRWRPDLMNNHGVPVIGLGARTEEHAALPLQWMPHIQVADVAASAARSAGLGGRELMHGRDDHGVSQWAVLLDPDGAAFGIIPVPPAEAVPPDTADPAGCIAGMSLATTDIAATRAFYQQVIGWTAQVDTSSDSDDSDTDSLMLDEDGHPAARIAPARASVPSPPPVWLIHLPVGDLPESLRRVQAEGGAVIMTTMAPDGTPAWAAIQDPVGAHLALVPG